MSAEEGGLGGARPAAARGESGSSTFLLKKCVYPPPDTKSINANLKVSITLILTFR